MVQVSGGRAGKFDTQFNAAETVVINNIATEYGLSKTAVVGSMIHKGFEAWYEQRRLKASDEAAEVEANKGINGGD